MSEFAYLLPSDWKAWSRCPGKPSLEESEAPLPEAAFLLTPAVMKAVAPRMAAYKARGTVASLYPYSRLDISVVTGEKGANVFVDAIILAPIDDEHSVLEVWHHGTNGGTLKILALAALVKYQLLHIFQDVHCVSFTPEDPDVDELLVTPDELYVFGKEVTEAAAVALAVRGDVTALSNLHPGALQCASCRAAYRCPELAKALDL